MNKERRKRIEDLKSELETIRDEEQEYYDNMPENMQNGEKGDTAQSNVSSLEEAINNLESIE